MWNWRMHSGFILFSDGLMQKQITLQEKNIGQSHSYRDA